MRTFVRAPFARRRWAELLYAVVCLPLGIAGFVFTVVRAVLGVAVPLSVTGLLVGPPLTAVCSRIARRFGQLHRSLARRLLGVRVEAPAPFQPLPGVIGWLRSAITDVTGWRARAYLLLKFPVAIASFLAGVVPLGYGLAFVFSPVAWGLFGHDGQTVNDHGVIRHSFVQYGTFYFDTWPKMWLLVAQGVVALLLAPWLLRAVLLLDRGLIYGLLAPPSLAYRVRDLEQTRAHAVDDAAARLRSIERNLHDGAQAQLLTFPAKRCLANAKLRAGP